MIDQFIRADFLDLPVDLERAGHDCLALDVEITIFLQFRQLRFIKINEYIRSFFALHSSFYHEFDTCQSN